MKTFAIATLGCKVNQYESQQIRQLLEQLGLRQVRPEQRPDLSLINTCCVTHTASAKSRQYIRKAQKLNRKATVVVFGCLPIGNSAELTGSGSDLILIRHRSLLAHQLSRIVTANSNTTTPKPVQHLNTGTGFSPIKPINNTQINIKNQTNLPKLPELTSFQGHTRAFLKVQDGCDRFCSYCIIPYCRADVQSKGVPAVLREAQNLVRAGHKEIVVTGIFLGAFGLKTTKRKYWPSSENPKLSELLEKLAQIPGLERIRLSSLEPADVTERLLDTLYANPNIMPHLHLSLQSGSDSVLGQMRRQYTAGQFLQKTDMIKSKLDKPAITTDVIVGFPGETDEDFEQTLSLAEKVGFSRIHVFSFSARKGTAAEKMKPKVNTRIIKRRAGNLQKLANELAYQYRKQFPGQTAQVLIERVDDNKTATGRAERYFQVNIPNAPGGVRKNELVSVILTSNTSDGMTGRLLDA